MNTKHIAKLFAAVAISGAALLTAGQASAMGWFQHHRGGGMMSNMDPAKMDEHLDRMIARAASDATAEQKAKLKDIAKAAMSDLKTIHQQMRDGHAKGVAILTAEKIDRAALESVRLDQMRLADAASQRISKALADMAEVLTPAQRAKLAEHLQAMHAKHAH